MNGEVMVTTIDEASNIRVQLGPIDVRKEYGHILKRLRLETLYSADALADLAIANDGLDANGAPLKQQRQRLLAVFSLFADEHGFPEVGDGSSAESRQTRRPAWFGRRWLDAFWGPRMPHPVRAGRPKKYQRVVLLLEDETFYSPACVADFGLKHVFAVLPPEKQHLFRQRLRITMARFAKNNHFPTLGDGLVITPGQAPRPGYLGKRWKLTYACWADYEQPASQVDTFAGKQEEDVSTRC